MKSLGWPFLALLAAVQLFGWIGYGRPAAIEAVGVIVLPSSILIGAALFWAFYWNRNWIPVMPMVLLLIHIEVTFSPRTKPGSSLLCHAADQFFGQKMGGWETFFANWLLLISMLLLATVAAFGTAEVHRFCTGQGGRGGRAFFRDLLRDLAFWEKTSAEEQNK